MRYLVATDGSAVSDTAVEHATVEAATKDARLDIVHVLTPKTKLVDGDIVLPGEKDAIDQGEQILEQAEQLVTTATADRDTDVEVTTELLTGRPAEAIAEYAEETGVDGIYVGHRGLSNEREQVVGSVAKSVIDKVSVPITIVR